MKKTFLFIIILLLLICALFGCSSGASHEIVIVPLPVKDRLALIDSFFDTEDFEGVKAIYDEAVGNDRLLIEQHIEEYALLYIDGAKKQLSTKKLEEFKMTGYEGSVLLDGIDLVKRLIASEAAYKEGKIAYNGRDFETAKLKLSAVDPEHPSYAIAKECLEEIAGREQAWQTSKYGRNQGTYALACDDDFIYIAYKHSGVYGILKAGRDGEYTEFIPLSDAGDFVITGINIVGNYIYFIAGEDVGRGLMFENPYNIYEMKTDGSGLALIKQGDYFDMAIHGSDIYALSYTKGLVQFDKTFSNESVISEESVTELCVAPEGVYYTVQSSLGSDNINTVYLYDEESHTKITSGSFAHYYVYAKNALKLVSTGSTNETLYLETDGSEEKINNTDILKVYGIVGESVIYSIPGDYAQERLKTYDIAAKSEQNYTSPTELPKFYITGISYETEQIFTVNADGIYVMDKRLENQSKLSLPDVDTQKLGSNKALLRHTADVELYSPEEENVLVLSDENLWYYSGPSLCVIMEKRYLEETETVAYITHIYTSDFSLITTDAWGDSADSKETAKDTDIAERFGIIYGQSTDYFNYNDDTRRGIVIRKGEVYRDHIYNSMLAICPDGMFATYEKGDAVSAEQLLNDGVLTSLSFGPVLVKDGFLSSSATNSKVVVRNPRSAIGMVEPGHYVSIVVDGRDSSSRGLTTVALGELFAEEGCKAAYNLDGGGTVSVTFLGNSMKLDAQYRNIPDMLYFGSSDIVPLKLDDYTMTYSEFKSVTDNEVEE